MPKRQSHFTFNSRVGDKGAAFLDELLFNRRHDDNCKGQLHSSLEQILSIYNFKIYNDDTFTS